MNQENRSPTKEEDLYLLFIDEERNKDLEKSFNSYINKYFNFNKEDKPDNIENHDYDKKESKIQPKIINVVMR